MAVLVNSCGSYTLLGTLPAESRFYEVRTFANSTVMYIFYCFIQPCVDTGAGRRPGPNRK
jgi:hypothetical protein